MCPEALINSLLDRAAAGQLSMEEMVTLKQYALDPECMDFVLAGMKARDLDQVGSEPLGPIGDYYVDGPEPFVNRWQLPPALPLPVPFAALDRRTQFFVLFGEWSRREMEGMMILNQGDNEAAEETFNECLARANQIGVKELVARSYEGLMRVAQRRNDDAAARAYSRQATEARNGA